MEHKGSRGALGLALNPAGLVSSGSTLSASLITGYQWVGKDHSFAFLHVACRVSWLPAPLPPCPSPSRAHLRSAAAGRPLSHRLCGGVGPAPDPETAPWLCLTANEPLEAAPSHLHRLFLQGAGIDLTRVFLASKASKVFPLSASLSPFLLRLCGS